MSVICPDKGNLLIPNQQIFEESRHLIINPNQRSNSFNKATYI